MKLERIKWSSPWWFRRINCSKLCYAGFSCWSRLQACKFSRSAPKKASKRWSSKAELQIWLTKSVRQEPVSSKHSYFATCLLLQQRNTGQLYFLQTGERYYRMRVKDLCEPRNLFPAIGLVASPAETCHQHKHFGLINLYVYQILSPYVIYK